MFQKVLVSEDMDDIHEGIYKTLSDLKITKIDQVQYCDDAFLKLKRAVLDGVPYDLLITDLSFTPDHRTPNHAASGEALIQLIKKEYTTLKVIVYSVEDRLQKVRRLLTDNKIDGYVCKGRKGLQELSKAIATVFNNDTYVSPQVKQALSPKFHLEVNEYDIQLMQLLSKGASQKQISDVFLEKNITPSGLSSIEKTLSRLKEQFEAKNTAHLLVLAKDAGYI